MTPAHQIDWPALATTCGEIWGELTWRSRGETVWGASEGYTTAAYIFAHGGDVCVRVTADPKSIDPRWDITLLIRIPIADTPDLARHLKQARKWWLGTRGEVHEP